MLAVAMGYGVVNWHADRELKKFVAECRADGFPVSREEAYGARSENDFSRHPELILEFSRQKEERLAAFAGMGIPGFSDDFGDWESNPELNQYQDIRKWAKPPRPNEPEEVVARDLLKILEPQIQRLSAMEDAFERRSECWAFIKPPHRYEQSELAPVSRLYQFLGDLALLHIAAGNADESLAVVEKMVEIRSLLRQRPTMMGVLVSAGMEQRLCLVVWEGIGRKVWAVNHLRQFQSIIGQPDALRPIAEAMKGELASMMDQGFRLDREQESFFDTPRGWGDLAEAMGEALMTGDLEAGKSLLAECVLKARPSGMNLLEEIEGARYLRANAIYDATTSDEASAFLGLRHEYGEEDVGGPLTAMMNGMVRSFAKRALLIHTRQSLLVSGIAIEIYRMERGEAPAALEDLVPEFIPEVPKDVMDGEPLRYKVLPDGSPHIWSLWPSGKDEDGMPARDGKKGNMMWTTGEITGLTEAVYDR